MSLLQIGIETIERGLIPDALVRRSIRRLCRQRLNDERRAAARPDDPARREFLASLRQGPIALAPEAANEQHYELPPDFFAAMLGPRRKYSCCHFSSPKTSLAEAEVESLALTSERAELADGQDILELGCGWGSLSLWMAQRYPHSQIVAVSNSIPQRRYIENQARTLGCPNLQVITADMNVFAPGSKTFDRVVSVEMFEHMRNLEELLSRIATWLRPAGKLFVHHFCHRELAYPFQTAGAANWMGRHFFTGGMMPDQDLLRRFERHFCVERQEIWNGVHYQRTADAWLANLDDRQPEVQPLLAHVYGPREARRWFQRWRVFLLAVSELFGYRGGEEWFVVHELLRRTTR